MGKIKLGISTCLLGEPVRYDGGHKLDRYLKDTLGQYVDYVAVCPEVECGLGTPRESMHLEGEPGALRLITTRTKQDLTDRMLSWSHRRVQELASEDLCGFIFKSNSPSSGMERVRVLDAKGVPHRTGTGLFAAIFIHTFPLIPVEDEGRLHDPGIRENFIERIFALERWRSVLKRGKKTGLLIEFHSRHKLQMMAHSPTHAREMGKLVAAAKATPPEELFNRYEQLMMEGLRLKATVRKNTNVLQHIMGYFKKELTSDEKRELLELIDNYYKGHLPLIVPLALLKHYVRKYEKPYLREQFYLDPHPVELQLRNHA
ncbi:MAG: YbgA family protein [Syntrophobacteraceae bacterium]